MTPGNEVRGSTRWSIRRRVTVWLVGSVVGAAVVSLPDSDDRLVSLSRTHGPSLVDSLGVLLLVVVWVPVITLLWRRRQALRGRSARSAGVLAVAGTVGLATTVGFDRGSIYLAAVALLVAAQMLALRAVARSGG